MRRPFKFLAVAVAAATVGVPASAAAARHSGGGAQQFCTSAIAVEKAFADASAEDREPSKKELARFKRRVEKALDRAEAAAPRDIATSVKTFRDAILTSFETGEEEEGPAALAAKEQIYSYLLQNCGFEHVEVTGSEYAFEGIPDTVEAGRVAFTFTNAGAELHELGIYRIKGNASVPELLELPERQVDEKVAFVGNAFAAQGASETVFLELEPGRYAAVCLIPVGSTSETAEPPADAHSHAVEGMAVELRVTKK